MVTPGASQPEKGNSAEGNKEKLTGIRKSGLFCTDFHGVK